MTQMVKVRKPAPERVREKCNARGFCGALVKVCGLGKQRNARGGLEISLSATRTAKSLKFRERAIVRQDGYKPVIVLDYCPFCGARFE